MVIIRFFNFNTWYLSQEKKEKKELCEKAKTKIGINDRTRKNMRCKIVNEFNQQPCKICQFFYINDTVQRLNYVVGYFNVKFYK